MQTSIQVENIRCGGCANTITKKLLENKLISAVKVDIESGTVTVESDCDREHDVRMQAVEILLKQGYPEKGSEQGIAAAIANKGKSFVSCAVGRMTSGDEDKNI